MPSLPIGSFEREGSFAHRVVLDYLGRDAAPSTVRQVKQVLRELAAAGVSESYQIDNTAIARWRLAHPSRGTETIKSHLRCLSAICTIAAHEGWIERDPFDLHSVKDRVRADARPKGPRRQYHRTPDEIREMLALSTKEAAGERWEDLRRWAYAHTLFLTGARAGEVQHLLARNVDHRNGTITIEPVEVPIRGGKTRWWRPKTVGSATTLPAGPRLLAVLAAWEGRRLSPEREPRYRIPIRRDCPWLFPGKTLVGPWTCGGPGVRPLDQIRDLGRRAGIDGLAQKSARKSVGTHAKTMGLGGLERKALFRHSDEATGDLYDEEAVESLRPAVIRIEGFYLTGT